MNPLDLLPDVLPDWGWIFLFIAIGLVAWALWTARRR